MLLTRRSSVCRVSLLPHPLRCPPLSPLLLTPATLCMLAGSDLAWGAIVLSLIKQWRNAFRCRRRGLCRWLWRASSCWLFESTCWKEWVTWESMTGIFFFFPLLTSCVWERCWLRPLDGDVIPFFTATRLLCGPTVEYCRWYLGSFSPWMWRKSCSGLHFHYYTAGDERCVKWNRRALPPHLRRTTLIFWPPLTRIILSFLFSLLFISHNRLICR